MNGFKRHIFKKRTQDINTNQPNCYLVEDIELSRTTIPCLSVAGDYITNKIKISLLDINGNPFFATQDLTFIARFESKTCYDQPITSQTNAVVLNGNSFVEIFYTSRRYADCGQGECLYEYETFLDIISTPIQYPDMVECSVTQPTYNSFSVIEGISYCNAGIQAFTSNNPEVVYSQAPTIVVGTLLYSDEQLQNLAPFSAIRQGNVVYELVLGEVEVINIIGNPC